METLLLQHPTEDMHTFDFKQNYTTYTTIPEHQIIPKPLPPITQYMIKQLLATQKFTKTSVASELRVSLVTINRWATGTIKHPTHKTFSRLLTLYCAVTFAKPQPTERIARLVET